MREAPFNSVVKVAGREIGLGRPCFVVAEIGINHNGDMDLAKREIDAAVAAGADAVKFQSYRVEEFLSNRNLTFTYTSQGQLVTEPQYDLFKRCELTTEALTELKRYCDKRRVIFQSTPMSPQGVRDLVDIGAPMLKNGSDALNHLPLIRAMGESRLPTIISTGMATIADIDEAVRAFSATGNRNLVLLHCISAYPTPVVETNLARIPSLAQVFGCPVGFSDHTQGDLAAALSVAFGACLVEKHFTLDHDLPGPDHWFSVTPIELQALVKSIRDAEAMIGTAALGPTPSEREGRREYRLSCVAASDLRQGHRLSTVDIAFGRPGHGVSPAQACLLSGRVLRQDVQQGHVFVLEDLV